MTGNLKSFCVTLASVTVAISLLQFLYGQKFSLDVVMLIAGLTTFIAARHWCR